MQDAQIPMYSPMPPLEKNLPSIGATRCYWTLLSSSLRFIYLDPVLQYHLQNQAEALVGKSIIDLVHPDEQYAAERDLSEVFQTGNLDGTLTRMRFSRLSRVRKMLGHQGPAHYWADAEKIAIDANWMAVDLVANVASDDLLLVFIHAAVDLSPMDSDPHHHSDWTNWCGTDAFGADAAPSLYANMCTTLPVPSQTLRVFQIISARQPHQLLLSWPPPQSHAPAAREFARLADGVNLSRDAPASSAAKTSCTRRFKAREQAMSSQDAYRLVDSVFIPHGSIVFACHHVKQARRASAPAAATPMHSLYMTQQHQEYLDGQFSVHSMTSEQYLPAQQQQPAEVPSQHPTHHHPHLHQHQALPTSQVPSQNHVQVPSQSYPGSQTQSATWSPASMTQGVGDWQGSYDDSPYLSATMQPAHSQWISGPNAFDSPNITYRSSSPQSYFASVSTPAEVPLPPVRVSPSSSSTSQTSVTSSGRNTGLPPAGVLRCSSCKVTHSPEWRKGPSGKKDLCNACGLRYARSRAKKEGVQGIRKRGKGSVTSTVKATRQGSMETGASNTLPAMGTGLDLGRSSSSSAPSSHVSMPVKRECFDDDRPTSSSSGMTVPAPAPALTTPSPPLYMHSMRAAPAELHATSLHMPGNPHAQVPTHTRTPPVTDATYHQQRPANTPPLHARSAYPLGQALQKPSYSGGFSGEDRTYVMQQQQAYVTQLPPLQQISQHEERPTSFGQNQDGSFMHVMGGDSRQQGNAYVGMRQL